MTPYHFVRANSLAMPLRSGIVDAIMFSPPYFALRDYQDDGTSLRGQIGAEPTPAEFVDALIVVMRECVRVLKRGGSIFVNIGDKYSQRVAPNRSSHQSGLQPDRSDVTKDWKLARELGLARMPSDNLVDVDGGRQPIREKSLMGLPWRFALRCIDELGLILRAEIIWGKVNGLPESVTDRVRRSHEHIFHFTMEGDYFAAIDEIREPSSNPRPGATWEERKANGEGPRYGNTGNGSAMSPMTKAAHPLGKLPPSVWMLPLEPLRTPDYFVEDANGWRMMDCAPLAKYVRYRTDGGDWSPVRVSEIDHYAAWPSEIPRRLILGWTPNGICTECGDGRRPKVQRKIGNPHYEREFRKRTSVDGGQPSGGDVSYAIEGYQCDCPEPSAPTTPPLVLDPFAGTGTTVGVARALGRVGVGFDLSADYLRLAGWRVRDSGDFVKVEARTNRERQQVLL